jgi:hypothetical protein
MPVRKCKCQQRLEMIIAKAEPEAHAQSQLHIHRITPVNRITQKTQAQSHLVRSAESPEDLPRRNRLTTWDDGEG